MNPEPIEVESQTQPELAVAVANKQSVAQAESKVIALTPAQARVESVADVLAKARAQASLLKLTPEEIAKLKADFPDEAFKMGAGGDPNLIYIEHAFLRDRFDEAIGMCQWSLIRSRPHWAEEYQTSGGKKAVRIYADCALVIRGCLVSEAIGEMSYFPNNAQQSYGDAAEGSETAAFRRCAKKIGVGLQAWKKDFGDGWKQRSRSGRPQQFSGHQNKPNPQSPAQPEPRSGSGLPSGNDEKRINELLEASKAKLIQSIGNRLPQLWCHGRRCGWLMPNERLEMASAHLFFPVAAKLTHYETAAKGIKGDYDKLMAEMLKLQPTDDEQAQFDACYGPPGTSTEEPQRPPKARQQSEQPEEWFWPVICPIPHKGEKRADYEKNPDTIESLYRAMKQGDEAAQKRLWGFARGWTPEPRTVNGKTYQPSEADLKFRKALNDFMSWHDEHETVDNEQADALGAE